MLGRHRRLLQNLSFFVDLLVAAALLSGVFWFLEHHNDVLERLLTALTGYPFHIQDVSHLEDSGWLFSLMLGSLFLCLKLGGYYGADPRLRFVNLGWVILKCVAAALAVTVAITYFLSIVPVNRSLIFGFYGMFFAYLLAKELVWREGWFPRNRRRAGYRAVWVGSAADWNPETWDELTRARLVDVAARVSVDKSGNDTAESDGPPVLGEIGDLRSILTRTSCDFLILGVSPRDTVVTREVLRVADEAGMEVWHLADYLPAGLSRPVVDEFWGRPVILYRGRTQRELQRVVKRWMDVAVSAAGLILLAPLFGFIALAVRWKSPGPVLFLQLRTGYRGRPFKLYKFRTMEAGAEESLAGLLVENEIDGPAFKLSDDPRVTPVGRWLRRFSLDELPQLWNVLRGDMSLVGPRPLPVRETEAIAEFRDRRRYSVPPGLTGLWQVSGRSDLRDFQEWVRLDLAYIDNWTLWLDLVILARTIPVVLRGNGAR